MATMRTHADIVSAVGPKAVADRYDLSIHTVRSWIARNKIPDEYWADFADRKDASLPELAAHAAQKREAKAA